MKKQFFLLLFLILIFLAVPERVLALENPLAAPNNKFGIHILFPQELSAAAKLVNSNGGQWGYVVIPIQAGDRDLDKWQSFMDSAKQYHVIPILRLATEGDYFNTKVWRKPTFADVLDFANFLNSLDWPVKNKYVVVFNEVNRADEWGGEANAAQYANLLYYASTIFKTMNEDFFIISAGLDNAAPNRGTEFISYDNFLVQMYQAQPQVFDSVDGLGSHSYPNPGFTQPPFSQNKSSISSFKFEKNIVDSFTSKNLPIFITETGWSNEYVSESTESSYYIQAFAAVWADPNIVTVAPFLLSAQKGPFIPFSFFHDGKTDLSYQTIEGFSKVKGEPTQVSPPKKNQPKIFGNQIKNFSSANLSSVSNVSLPKSVKNFLKWLMKL